MTFEGTASCPLTIKVADAGSLTDSEDVMITFTDVSESPVISNHTDIQSMVQNAAVYTVLILVHLVPSFELFFNRKYKVRNFS